MGESSATCGNRICRHLKQKVHTGLSSQMRFSSAVWYRAQVQSGR